MRDLRESDQWSASLSEYRLPDGSEKTAAPLPNVSPAQPTERTVLTPLTAAPVAAPAAPPEQESVEDLLRHVQYTVVEGSRVRAFFFQATAALIVLVPAVMFAPKLVQHLDKLRGRDITPTATSAKPEPKKAPAPANNSAPADNSVSSSSSSGPWKPFQNKNQSQRPSSASVNKQKNFSASAPVQRAPGNAQNTWGEPVQQPRRDNSFASSPRQVIARPPAVARSFDAPPRETTPATISMPSAAPAPASPGIAIFSPGASGDGALRASIQSINEPAANLPAWMQKPTEEWPPIVLQNEGRFRGHPYLQGSNCLLVDAGVDNLWLAMPTALLGEQGGVVPPIPPADLRRYLVRWNITSPANGRCIGEVQNGATFRMSHDVNSLVMKVPEHDGQATVKALSLRGDGLIEDETLYLVTQPTLEGSAQRVFPAKVTYTTSDGPDFRFSLAGSIDVTAFLGAALLDKSGHLAGMVINGNSRGTGTAATAASLARLISSK